LNTSIIPSASIVARRIIVLPIVLASSGCDNRTSPPSAPYRHQEPWSGYSIEVPTSWEAVYPVGARRAVLKRKIRQGGYAVGSIVIERTFTRFSHDAFARRLLNSEHFIVDSKLDGFHTTDGLSGARLLASKQLPGKEARRLAVFCFERGEVVYQLT